MRQHGLSFKLSNLYQGKSGTAHAYPAAYDYEGLVYEPHWNRTTSHTRLFDADPARRVQPDAGAGRTARMAARGRSAASGTESAGRPPAKSRPRAERLAGSGPRRAAAGQPGASQLFATAERTASGLPAVSSGSRSWRAAGAADAADGHVYHGTGQSDVVVRSQPAGRRLCGIAGAASGDRRRSGGADRPDGQRSRGGSGEGRTRYRDIAIEVAVDGSRPGGRPAASDSVADGFAQWAHQRRS